MIDNENQYQTEQAVFSGLASICDALEQLPDARPIVDSLIETNEEQADAQDVIGTQVECRLGEGELLVIRTFTEDGAILVNEHLTPRSDDWIMAMVSFSKETEDSSFVGDIFLLESSDLEVSFDCQAVTDPKNIEDYLRFADSLGLAELWRQSQAELAVTRSGRRDATEMLHQDSKQKLLATLQQTLQNYKKQSE